MVSSCTSTDNNNKKDKNTTDTTSIMKDSTIKWDIAAKGTQCAAREPQQLLIMSQAAFDTLWNEFFTGIDIPVEKPAIDFKNKWAIVAFKGFVSNGGHDVDIKSISHAKDEINVIIRHVKPGKGCMSSMAEEYPYVIATVNQLTGKKFIFKVEEEEKICE
jgi:hypothetical protein